MQITKLMSVKAAWESFSFPIKAGTPVNIHGALSNSAAAIGIVPQPIKVKPNDENIYIMTGGKVDAAEIDFPSLATDAKRSMNGITFYGSDGTPEIDPVYDAPTAATETTLGLVKMAANVAEAAGSAPTAAEFKALLDALIEAGIMAEAAES